MYDKKDFEATRAMTMDMMHNEGTSQQIVQMLGAGDPQMTIPKTAATVNGQVMQAYQQRGKPLSLENQLANSIIIGAELVEIGNAAGIFEVTEREAPAVLEKSSKAVIQQGLKNGTIDPVELQELTNDGMPERMKGMGLANESTPNERDDGVAMEQYAQKRVAQDRKQRPQEGGMLNGKL